MKEEEKKGSLSGPCYSLGRRKQIARVGITFHERPRW